MRTEKSAQIRTQMAGLFEGFAALKKSRPKYGWVRSLREALGMSGRQLAVRLKVQPPRITEMEKAEKSGNITLGSLRRAAEAMDCELVYGFAPKTNLEETLRRQAGIAAARQQAGAAHSMLLENQSLSVKEAAGMLDAKVEELIRTTPRRLWDLE